MVEHNLISVNYDLLNQENDFLQNISESAISFQQIAERIIDKDFTG